MKKHIFKLGLFIICLILPTLFTRAASAPAPIISNVDIMHRHTGSSAGGGCYGSPNICGGTMETRTENPHGCGINAAGGGCPHCGCWYEPPSAMYPSGCAHCNCPKPTVTRCTRCGKEGGGGTCSAVSSYGLNCGKNTSTVMGKITLTSSTVEWTDKLQISASVENYGIPLNASAYIWNDLAPGNQATIEVTANGEYRCRLSASVTDTTNVNEVMAKIKIGNIDDISPQINALVPHTTEWVSDKVTVTVDAQDNEMGLAAQAYSYDSGNTWVSENNIEYYENGTYEIRVKDLANNIATGSITINNIDKTAPAILNTEYNQTPNIINTTLIITADDLQPDGTPGVGLHPEAFSYDGGNTWGSENTKLMKDNGVYIICVRDILLNTSSVEVTISNIDSTPPVISAMKQDPESWSNQDVRIWVEAADTGSGIEAYSWDDGVTWIQDDFKIVSQNGVYRVMVRDCCGNIASLTKEVNNIDKVAPSVSWSMSPDEKSWFQNNATIYINATDNLSGVYLYSFDGGGTWVHESAIQISDDQYISVRVRDCAGNIASLEISAKKQLLPVLPVIPPKENKPKDIIKEVVEKPIKKISPDKITIPDLKMEKKVVKAIEYKSPLPKYNVMPIVAGTAAGTSLLTFCSMYFFPLIPIYGRKVNGQYKLLGAAIIKRKNKNYYLYLKDFHMKKAETNNFKIRLGKVFAHANKDKNFIIKIKNKEIMRKVDRELCF